MNIILYAIIIAGGMLAGIDLYNAGFNINNYPKDYLYIFDWVCFIGFILFTILGGFKND